MKYERLTKREWHNTKFSQLNEREVLKRLWELENKIEDGRLIEKYFIDEDELANGKIWYNVCQYCDGIHNIIKQCDTREQAEARLKELRGE